MECNYSSSNNHRVVDFVKSAILISLAALLLQPLSAAYTYVDAKPGNTTLDGATLIAGTNCFAGTSANTGSGTDGLWTFRIDSAAATFEGGDYFETDNAATSGDAEATGNLVTAINLPVAGQYEIVALFSKNTNRDIAAKLASPPGAGNVFTTTNGGSAAALTWDASYLSGRGSNAGAAALGTITTTVANQTVFVHLNGFKSITNSTIDERTQYDGIGYQQIIPPTAIHRDVFILAGQSNADGRGIVSELTGNLAGFSGQQPTVILHYTNPAYSSTNDQSRYRKWVPLEPGYSVAPGSSGALPRNSFGPEIGIGKVLAQHFAHPALIKVTQGGTSLTISGTNWYPAPLGSATVGPLYTALIESTRLALQQITAAGETYTVHALFWHQGESDSANSSSYANLYPVFVDSIRRDLGLPRLRVITGQLAPNRDPTFESVQWQLSRTLRNVSFVSSENLTTSDAQTHFNTMSMTAFGQRYGNDALRSFTTINFDAPLFTTWALDRQNDFSSTDPTQPTVVTTTTQGAYQGGQAAGHVGSAGAYYFNRREVLPLASLYSMRADFFAGDTGYDNDSLADSSLRVRGWINDADQNGNFSDSEASIGFGLEDDGRFVIRAGSTIARSTGALYQTDRWYRLTLDWTDPDAAGNRVASLRVRDLLTDTDLNSGQPLVQTTVSDADFGGDPGHWFGTGFKVTRGLIDNISAEAPGFDGWSRRYPTLTGGRDGDDDFDGLSNLAEYALSLDPTRADPGTVLPMPVLGPNNVTLSIIPEARLADVTYQADWSSDLANWTTLPGVTSGTSLIFSVPRQPQVFMRQRFTVSP